MSRDVPADAGSLYEKADALGAAIKETPSTSCFVYEIFININILMYIIIYYTILYSFKKISLLLVFLDP
jgi:hypothetical protein